MAIHAEVLSLAILVAITIVPASSAAEEPVLRPRALPDGVASPDGRAGFLAIPDVGVRVVDLKRGEYVGTIRAEDGLRPLIATDKAVITMARPDGAEREPDSSFSLARVDFRTLRVEVRSHRIILPKWVAPPGRKPRGDWGRQSLHIEARIIGESLLVLWEARQWPSGGMVRSDARGGPIQHAGEMVVLPLSDPSLPVVKTIPIEALDDATLAAFDRPPDRFAAIESLEYVRGGVPSTSPLLAAGKVVVFGARESGSRKSLILRAWDPADPVDETAIELAEVRGDLHRLEVTLDGQHLLVSEGDPIRRGSGPRSRSLFSLPTGRLLAHFPSEPGMMAGSVLDGRFFYGSLVRSGSGAGATITRQLNAAVLRADGLERLWRLELPSRSAPGAAPPPPPSFQPGS